MTRGLPDHYRHTLISRREIALELQQETWYWMSSEPSLSYGPHLFDTEYTVPPGKRLVIEYVNFSSNTYEVHQYAALVHLVDEVQKIFLGSDFLTEKFIHCRRPLDAGDHLYIYFFQRDRYKPRDFDVMIHGYTEPA